MNTSLYCLKYIFKPVFLGCKFVVYYLWLLVAVWCTCKYNVSMHNTLVWWYKVAFLGVLLRILLWYLVCTNCCCNHIKGMHVQVFFGILFIYFLHLEFMPSLIHIPTVYVCMVSVT